MKKENFEMSLFYFPSDPKASAVAAWIILNAQLEIFFTVTDYYAESVST